MAEGDKIMENGQGREDKKEEHNLCELEKCEKLHDIPMKIEGSLGEATILVRDLINLQAGSVIELERNISDTIDVKVNGVPVAKGEMVIVGDKIGIRITEISETQ